MKRNLVFLLAFIAIIFASCSKDKTNTDPTAIRGTYKLKFLSAKVSSTVTGSGEKAVTLSEYTTINNGGTIVIDGSTFKGTDLTYEIKTTATTSYYQGNRFIDSISVPVNAVIPPITSTASYKLIGADSIYFENGSFVSDIGTGQNGGNGGKYTFTGKTLTIMQHATKDTVIRISGEIFRQVDGAHATFVLEKN